MNKLNYFVYFVFFNCVRIILLGSIVFDIVMNLCFLYKVIVGVFVLFVCIMYVIEEGNMLNI